MRVIVKLLILVLLSLEIRASVPSAYVNSFGPDVIIFSEFFNTMDSICGCKVLSEIRRDDEVVPKDIQAQLESCRDLPKDDVRYNDSITKIRLSSSSEYVHLKSQIDRVMEMLKKYKTLKPHKLIIMDNLFVDMEYEESRFEKVYNEMSTKFDQPSYSLYKSGVEFEKFNKGVLERYQSLRTLKVELLNFISQRKKSLVYSLIALLVQDRINSYVNLKIDARKLLDYLWWLNYRINGSRNEDIECFETLWEDMCKNDCNIALDPMSKRLKEDLKHPEEDWKKLLDVTYGEKVSPFDDAIRGVGEFMERLKALKNTLWRDEVSIYFEGNQIDLEELFSKIDHPMVGLKEELNKLNAALDPKNSDILRATLIERWAAFRFAIKRAEDYLSKNSNSPESVDCIMKEDLEKLGIMHKLMHEYSVQGKQNVVSISNDVKLEFSDFLALKTHDLTYTASRAIKLKPEERSLLGKLKAEINIFDWFAYLQAKKEDLNLRFLEVQKSISVVLEGAPGSSSLEEMYLKINMGKLDFDDLVSKYEKNKEDLSCRNGAVCIFHSLSEDIDKASLFIKGKTILLNLDKICLHLEFMIPRTKHRIYDKLSSKKKSYDNINANLGRYFISPYLDICVSEFDKVKDSFLKFLDEGDNNLSLDIDQLLESCVAEIKNEIEENKSELEELLKKSEIVNCELQKIFETSEQDHFSQELQKELVLRERNNAVYKSLLSDITDIGCWTLGLITEDFTNISLDVGSILMGITSKVQKRNDLHKSLSIKYDELNQFMISIEDAITASMALTDQKYRNLLIEEKSKILQSLNEYETIMAEFPNMTEIDIEEKLSDFSKNISDIGRRFKVLERIGEFETKKAAESLAADEKVTDKAKAKAKAKKAKAKKAKAKKAKAEAEGKEAAATLDVEVRPAAKGKEAAATLDVEVRPAAKGKEAAATPPEEVRPAAKGIKGKGNATQEGVLREVERLMKKIEPTLDKCMKVRGISGGQHNQGELENCLANIITLCKLKDINIIAGYDILPIHKQHGDTGSRIAARGTQHTAIKHVVKVWRYYELMNAMAAKSHEKSDAGNDGDDMIKQDIAANFASYNIAIADLYITDLIEKYHEIKHEKKGNFDTNDDGSMIKYITETRLEYKIFVSAIELQDLVEFNKMFQTYKTQYDYKEIIAFDLSPEQFKELINQYFGGKSVDTHTQEGNINWFIGWAFKEFKEKNAKKLECQKVIKSLSNAVLERYSGSVECRRELDEQLYKQLEMIQSYYNEDIGIQYIICKSPLKFVTFLKETLEKKRNHEIFKKLYGRLKLDLDDSETVLSEIKNIFYPGADDNDNDAAAGPPELEPKSNSEQVHQLEPKSNSEQVHQLEPKSNSEQVHHFIYSDLVEFVDRELTFKDKKLTQSSIDFINSIDDLIGEILLELNPREDKHEALIQSAQKKSEEKFNTNIKKLQKKFKTLYTCKYAIMRGSVCQLESIMEERREHLIRLNQREIIDLRGKVVGLELDQSTLNLLGATEETNFLQGRLQDVKDLLDVRSKYDDATVQEYWTRIVNIVKLHEVEIDKDMISRALMAIKYPENWATRSK